MIDQKQLRLGNLFLHWGKFHKVTQLGEESPIYAVRVGFEKYPQDLISEDAEPIPLTPEWLERCRAGFFEADTATESFINLVYAGKVIATFKNDSLPPCQYLHQLQNLIHALTAAELEIKLP